MIIKNCDHKIVILITWIGRKNRKCNTHEIVKKKEILLLFLLLLLQCSRIINKRNEFIHRNILFCHSTNSSLYRHFNKFMVIFSPPLSRTWTLYLHRFSFIFLLLLNLPPASSSSPALLPYSHWSTILIFFWLFVRYFLENEEFVFINQRIVLADSRNFNILISFFFLTFLLILYYFLSSFILFFFNWIENLLEISIKI